MPGNSASSLYYWQWRLSAIPSSPDQSKQSLAKSSTLIIIIRINPWKPFLWRYFSLCLSFTRTCTHTQTLEHPQSLSTYLTREHASAHSHSHSLVLSISHNTNVTHSFLLYDTHTNMQTFKHSLTFSQLHGLFLSLSLCLRPSLHSLLHFHIPRENWHFRKKILPLILSV